MNVISLTFSRGCKTISPTRQGDPQVKKSCKKKDKRKNHSKKEIFLNSICHSLHRTISVRVTAHMYNLYGSTLMGEDMAHLHESACVFVSWDQRS